jgi:DNA-binding NtrC family response regulator
MVDEFRILVVEDDAILRKVILAAFAKFAAVAEASGAREAIAYLKSNHVDLIFSDMCMPEGEGTELVDWVQSNYKTAPAIVLITGQVQITSAYAVSKGAYALIEKPFYIKDLKVIAQTIKSELESGSRGRSS